MENNLQKPKTTAKDFFFYLGAVALLYVSFGSLLTLLLNYIDYYFPDALSPQNYYDPYSSAIRFSLAMLIILFPVFYAATWYLNKNLRINPEKQDMGIRKWLLYLTLFVSLGIVIGDLVVLVNTFLNGEITTRFVLKVFSVLLLAGFVLTYYWLDLKGKYIEKPMLGRTLGLVAAVFVVASVIGGFFVIGSPASQRLVRFDQQKVNDLQSIQWQIVNFWQAKQKLPQNLIELKDPISGQIIPIDAQSGKSYEYLINGALSFKLCASFNKESVASGYSSEFARPAQPMAPQKGVPGIDDNWQHATGYVCFDRTIDPDLYPPLPRK
ncbi:MAG: DUF5671 domain-containing protein [Patescibacteria group bacterium]